MGSWYVDALSQGTTIYGEAAMYAIHGLGSCGRLEWGKKLALDRDHKAYACVSRRRGVCRT